MKLACVGSRCATITKAMPPSEGRAPKNLVSAARPPADEPTPTIAGTLAGAAGFGGRSRGVLLAGFPPVVFFDRLIAATRCCLLPRRRWNGTTCGREAAALEGDACRARHRASSGAFRRAGRPTGGPMPRPVHAPERELIECWLSLADPIELCALPASHAGAEILGLKIESCTDILEGER